MNKVQKIKTLIMLTLNTLIGVEIQEFTAITEQLQENTCSRKEDIWVESLTQAANQCIVDSKDFPSSNVRYELVTWDKTPYIIQSNGTKYYSYEIPSASYENTGIAVIEDAILEREDSIIEREDAIIDRENSIKYETVTWNTTPYVLKWKGGKYLGDTISASQNENTGIAQRDNNIFELNSQNTLVNNPFVLLFMMFLYLTRQKSFFGFFFILSHYSTFN